MAKQSTYRPNQDRLVLVSHGLCPYVQRAAIVASEAGIELDRIVVDLAKKPEWFSRYSPTGKVPLLLVGESALFESAAIAEFLNEIAHAGMLPHDPVERARQRAWVEFASGILGQIANLYTAADLAAFERALEALCLRFSTVGREVEGPWFGGQGFGLVDAAFAPVFRYLDTFESAAGVYLLPDMPALLSWRLELSQRPSVKEAVATIYPDLLREFLINRGSYISSLMAGHQEAAA